MNLTFEEMVEIFNIPLPDFGASEEEIKQVQEKYNRAYKIAENISSAYRLLSQELNSMGGEEEVAKILLKCIVKDHRTLQQSWWRYIFNVMKKYGNLKPTIYSDLRNESSINICKKVTEEDHYFPFV